MKLNSINYQNYALLTNFGNISKVANGTIEEIRDNIPKLKFDKNPYAMGYEALTKARNEYIDNLYSFFFDEKGKLIPELERYLDNTIFDIEVPLYKGHSVVHSTIKDYIRDSISNPRVFSDVIYHGTPSPSAIDNILQTGFNPRFISNTRLGPGFYFSQYGEAANYGTVLKALGEGILADAKARFYENVTSYPITQKIGDYIGLTSEVCDDITTEIEFPKKLINEYSRNFIIENLGIDALSGYGGATPRDFCLVILNPKSIKNIEKL